MKVVNRINNNVVLVNDGTKLMIVTGKGLGFKVYPDDSVDESLIEQRYVLEEKDVAQYISILREIPKEYIDTARDVVSFGEEKLGKKLPVNLIFALADHFFFAFQRTIKNQLIEHPLKWEIQQLYPQEIEIGQYAVEVLNTFTATPIPDTEIVFVAMHFINYSYENSSDYDPTTVIERLNGAISILENTLGHDFDKNSPTFSRFVIHLRFFIIRMLRLEYDNATNDVLRDAVKTMYPEAYRCAELITEYLQGTHQEQVVEAEVVYLALHINRLIEDRREKNHV